MDTTRLLFLEDSYLTHLHTRVVRVEGSRVMTEATIFYAQGGGQPGDSGTFVCADGRRLAVLNSCKGAPGQVWHELAEEAHGLQPGDAVEQSLDWERRYRHMQLHTAMHLLCSVVGCGVTGGNLSADKARLDFAADSVSLERESLQQALNALIAADHPVLIEEVDEIELERNPGLVKTLSVQPPRGSGRLRLIHVPGVDRQPCGGTHVARTGEIAALEIRKIESKGARNKRVIIGWQQSGGEA